MAKGRVKDTKGVFESPELENSCKTLYANISFADIDGDGIRVICITSSVPNEGKTSVATNLALSFARAGKPTLIIDADMRRKSIARRLGLKLEYGLYAVMAGRKRPAEAIVQTKYPNLSFLDAEAGIPNPTALLSSARFASLMRHLRGRFAYIVIDTPPTNTFADSAVVSGLADGTVLVVRRKFTKRREVRNAIAQLQQANANLLGTAFTFCDKYESEYYYYYDYYGKGSSKNKEKFFDMAMDDDVQDFDANLAEWEQSMGFEDELSAPASRVPRSSAAVRNASADRQFVATQEPTSRRGARGTHAR